MAVKAIPDGYHSVTPFLLVKGADKLIDFAKKAFNAKEMELHKNPDGSIMHATIKIDDSMIMLSEANEKWPAMPSMLHLYVKDVDTVYKRALQAGGVSMREPVNEFYGDRSGGVKDPCGNQWWVATHIEDISPQEMKRRAEAYSQQQQQ